MTMAFYGGNINGSSTNNSGVLGLKMHVGVRKNAWC